MTDRTGILCLGTRPDAGRWEKGCRALGFDAPLPIKKPAPTMEQLTRFFAGSYDWVFFGGHFSGNRLYNESGSVGVRFSSDAVVVEVGSDSTTLVRGTAALGLRPRLVLWGGCSTLGASGLVRDLDALFGTHTMVGFRGVTGWKVVDAALGGGFLAGKRHFFSRVEATSGSAELTAAWMQTARLGWSGSTLEDRFAAVDATGQRWVLRDGRVVRDSKLF